jgi:hypothetical protein
LPFFATGTNPRIERVGWAFAQPTSAELAEIRQQAQTPWWERLAGGFKDDPHFDKILEAGKAYRRSLTPREC